MKKHVLTLLPLIFLCSVSFAQIPNAGFETWTNNDPDGWVTTNGLTLLGNPQSVFKSTDAHSGSFACEINTVQITNKPPGVFVPDYTGSIFTGKQVFVSSYFGFPCTVKPGKLNFWYKYNARNNDTATVLAYTTRWNSSLGKRDTLSIAVSILTDSVGVYTMAEVMFMVMDSVSVPDSAVVLFASASVMATQAGSKLVLDDVSFAGGTVGLKETNTPLTLEVYPNPVNNGLIQLSFAQPEANVKVSLIDINGRVVSEHTGQAFSGSLIIDIGQPSFGMYILSVQTENGNAIKRLIIN